MQPNPEVVGVPNPPTNKKIFLSNFEYKILNFKILDILFSDQCLGTVHPFLHKKGAPSWP